MKNITIIGDGGWGTTLAIYLARKGFQVKIWGAFPDYIATLRKTHENSKFLKGIKIPSSVEFFDNLQTAICEAELIVLAVPSQYVISVLQKLRKCDLSQKIILSVIKGVDTKSLKRMSELISEHLRQVKLAVLSGPTIAREVALGIPSTAVISSKDHRIAKKLQEVFHSKTFRIYTNSDMVGVELGGSIKNIIAIACGVCDGLGLGTNTKAAIVTRGLAEMTRLGKALGAKAKTFSGLSGLGDLVTTCMSTQSRNRYVGEEIGKGKSIKTIMRNMEMVAEGIPTVKAIYLLSQKHKISAPITTEVYHLIYQGKKPIAAVVDLMSRKQKAE
ncbi:MAG: NAD(P)H-dependent glycerol-3-phosphate dehydrogenase [Candidatus Omnitrophota bacterium]